MVKIVHNLEAEFARARKRIEELEKQNRTLIHENKRLRVSRGDTTNACSLSPSECDTNNQTSKRHHDFTKPTRASQNRAAAIKREKSQAQSTERVERMRVTIDDKTYIYNNCHPVYLESPDWLRPRFMQGTESTREKQKWIIPKTRNWPTEWDDSMVSESTMNTESSNEWGNAQSDSDNWKEEAVDPQPSPATSSDRGMEIYKQLGESVKERLDNQEVFISSKTGLHILTKAHTIAQEAIYEAARKFWPRKWEELFRDGPHLVRLGRSELQSCFGDYGTSVDLSLCGSSQSMVFSSLMYMPYLRNTICHPSSYSLQEVAHLDALLQYAHRLSLVLKDEERSIKMRTLRDELYQVAAEVLDGIQSLSTLAAMPLFNDTAPKWEFHHERLFHSALDRVRRDYGDVREDVQQVSQTWMLTISDGSYSHWFDYRPGPMW